MRPIKRAIPLAIMALLALPAAASAAPAWTAPGALSATGQNAGFSDVSMAEDGAAAVSWQRSNGASDVVEVAVRPPFGQFGEALALLPETEDPFPQVAIDGAGEALVVWGNRNGKIEIARVNGGLASAPTTLSAGTGEAGAPVVAIDEHGAAVVAWMQGSGPGQQVEASYRSAGGQFGEAQLLSSTSEIGEHPRVAIDAAGDATVIWSERAAGGKTKIEGATRLAAASRFSVAPISADFESAQLPFPAIATDAAGDTVVGWAQGGIGSNDTLHLMERPAGGEFAPLDLPEAKAEGAYLAVGLDGAGGPSVAWEGEYSVAPSVDFASGPRGGPLSSPRPIAPGAMYPALAENEAGDVLLGFESYKSAAASFRPAGGSFEAPVSVSPGKDTIEVDGGPGLETQLTVTLDGEGDGLFGYTASNGMNAIVTQSMLDAGGPVLEGLSIPESGVAGSPVSFTVTPRDQLSNVQGTTWSFGDATTVSGTSVTHTFANPGTYAVSLAATDALGNSTTQTSRITIAPAEARQGKQRPPRFKGAHLVTHSARAGRHGALRLRVACPASSGCKGRVTLTLKARAAGLGLPATAIVGHDSFRAKARGRASVTFKLSKPLLKLLRKRHRLRMAVIIEAQDVYRTTATTHGKVKVHAARRR